MDFEFKQCTELLKSTGKKANNINELREIISTIDNKSLYHHTFQYFLKGHILEYTNDFAQWVGESLEDRELSERLSNIDPYEFNNIEETRAELLKAIDEHMTQFNILKEVIPVREFYFNQTVTLIFSTGVKARNMAEFLIAIKYIDASSLYYHFYDARSRNDNKSDDFSRWFETVLNKPEPAKKIRGIDPFMHGIEKIREHIIAIVEAEERKEMETI